VYNAHCKTQRVNLSMVFFIIQYRQYVYLICTCIICIQCIQTQMFRKHHPLATVSLRVFSYYFIRQSQQNVLVKRNVRVINTEYEYNWISRLTKKFVLLFRNILDWHESCPILLSESVFHQFWNVWLLLKSLQFEQAIL